MKSFLKSLPSHRKKEKGKRKSRHHKSRDNEEGGGGGGGERGVTIGLLDETGELNLDYRRGQIRNAMSSTSEIKESQCSQSSGLMSALTDEGSCVAGTQIQFPPPLAFSIGRQKEEKEEEDDEEDNHDNDATQELFQSQLSLLSESMRPPPPPPSDNNFADAKTEDLHDPSNNEKPNDNDNKHIEGGADVENSHKMENNPETNTDKIGLLDRPVKKDEISSIKNDASLGIAKLVDTPNVENESEIPTTTTAVAAATKIMTASTTQRQASNTTLTLKQKETAEEQDEAASDDGSHASLDLLTQQLKKHDSKVVTNQIETSKPKSSLVINDTNELKTKTPRQHPSSPVARSQESSKSQDQPIIQQQHHQQQQKQPVELPKSSPQSEFLLSLSDIRQCIEELEEAKRLSEENPSLFDIDIAKFHDFVKQFEKYITALGNPTSIEAEELQEIQNDEDKVFAIFDRGISIDHCNVMFIRDVICTISSGIDDQKRSNLSQSETQSIGDDEQRKLDQLAIGLDFVFGISDVGSSSSSQSKVGVTISNSPNDNGTKLCFAKRPPSTIVNKPPSAIPTQLDEMLSFASNQARTLQSQAVATRLALSKLRSHAMTLQAQALKATDRALHADNETKFVREQFEVELCNRQIEYEMQRKSFEKARESYGADLQRKQLELDQTKERYERELKEARDELFRLKTTRGEREQTGRSDDEEEATTNGRKMPKQRQYGNHRPNGDGSIGRDNHLSSRPKPRNNDYKSSNPIEDADSKRRKSSESGNVINGGNNNNNTTNNSKHRAALKSHSVNTFPDKAQTKTIAAKKSQTQQSRVKTEDAPFAYQEVVRKRDERMALPGHDCEECRKFLDAMEAAGGDIDREEIINNCSRHRSKHKPMSTPPHYWTLSFCDSQLSE